ncbi:hypothetical protein GC197_17980 [bacterium]|nr:hypothetical protein [bacterium]
MEPFINEPSAAPIQEVAPLIVVPSWQKYAALVLVAVSLGFEILMMSWLSQFRELTFFWRIGQTGLIGFLMASGGMHRLIRWSVAAIAVFLLAITEVRIPFPPSLLYLMVAALVAIGWTYIARMVISVARGESSQLQRFSILGMMVTTACCAVCVALLQTAIDDSSAVRFVFIALVFVLLGLSIIAQCVPLWTRSWLEALFFALLAIAFGIVVPLIISGLEILARGNPSLNWDTLFLVWISLPGVWLTAYPIAFACHVFGFPLINPSWKIGAKALASPTPEISNEPADFF